MFYFSCQDKSIEEQLSMGIRYFDLRIAHKPNDSSSNLYFTHVIYSHVTVLVSLIKLDAKVWAFIACFQLNILPLQETLMSVATWLESHPKEVVILDCSHFEGMDNECHESFIFSLKIVFGLKLCPRGVSFLCVQLINLRGMTLCLITSNLPSTGISPDLAESVGIWLPGHPVLRLPDCSSTSGALA